MAQNLLEQDVKAFVQQKVASGASFTAFDITDEFGGAKHRYVRPIVHEMFENGEMSGYDKDIDNTISGAPIRYAPAQVVAAKYVVPTVTAPKPVAPVQSASKSVTLPSAPSVTLNTTPLLGSEDVSTNENGTRLRVRKHTVAMAGFNSGTKLYVTYSPSMKSVVLSTSPQTTNDPNAVSDEVLVDVKQNVRLNIEKLGIKGTSFSSTHGKGVVVVNVS